MTTTAAPRWIQPLEEDVVNLLLTGIPYLAPGSGGLCKVVADEQTYMSLNEPSPPFVFVRYGGETANPPEVIGGAQQLSEFRFMLYVGAMSFSKAGEGISDNLGGNRGLFGMLDDIFWTLQGRLLPSSPQNPTKLFFVSHSVPGVESHRVTALSTWYARVLRVGNRITNGT